MSDLRKIVLPGEMLDKQAVGEVYKENDKYYSATLGVLEDRGEQYRVVPLHGKYIPNEGDMVIGIVVNVKYGHYLVDINSPYIGFLFEGNNGYNFDYLDVILARVVSVNEVKNVVLENAKKLEGGTLLEVIPVKVPRIIGKRDSMLNILKEGTGCDIIIGKNGRIWVKNGNISLLKRALDIIQRESHTTGLTERIKKFLEEEGGKNEKA